VGDPEPDVRPGDLASALAPAYARAGVADRILLSGHSHQAWPDVALEGQIEALDDAARLLDAKWERAFAKAEAVREGFRGWLAEPAAEIALGASTHELVLRFLSALDLRRRPRLITTDGEFHTLRRQLARLGEAGLEVVRVPSPPAATLAERIAALVDDRTGAVLVSAVQFETAHVVPGLHALAESCARVGAELLVDAYHALGPMPFPVGELGLETAWIVGGGYKYLQLGEGNCFLRLPAHADTLRPAITGWFAEFAELADEHDPDRVAYGAGAARFAGATYDPTSHYRAARVFAFFAERRLTAALLRASYRRQLDVLRARFDALDLPEEIATRDHETPPDAIGGFLALVSPHAGRLQRELEARGVRCDSRGRHLRLGPAPYVSDAQLEAAVGALGEVARPVYERSGVNR
jgi:kynureninase